MFQKILEKTIKCFKSLSITQINVSKDYPQINSMFQKNGRVNEMFKQILMSQ